MTNAAVATIPTRNSLVAKFAGKYTIDPDRLLPILKATAFRQGKDDPEVTNEQMAALLVVADQYGLNPFTKEIFAFADKHKGVVPVVGVDGWARIINSHPQFDGMDFEQTNESCTCIIYRKDRAHPIKVTEYLSECKRGTQPWSSHPKRMLRHKATIQCARLAFGYAGIFDEDEAERIIEMGNAHVVAQPTVEQPRAKSAPKTEAATQAQEVTDAVVVDQPAAKGEKINGDGVIHQAEAAAETKTDDRPILPNQLKILRAKMGRVNLDDAALIAKFGPIEKLLFTQFAEIQKWIDEAAQ